MKIGQLAHSQKLAATTGDARQKNASPIGKDGQAPAGEGRAKVELSAAASALAAEGNTADFDGEKVARMAQAIRDGLFEVDAEAVADKLIAHTRDLLTPRSH